jgi:hypothetical protein
MIFMVLNCVLYMTLIVFIYVYYELFIYTNLVDDMSLFFTIFRSIYRFLIKIGQVPTKTDQKLPKPADLSAKPTNLSVFPIFTPPVFLSFFYRFFQNPLPPVFVGRIFKHCS